MNQLIVLQSEKRRLISKLLTLQGTLKKTQNNINEKLKKIDELQIQIEKLKKGKEG